MCMGKRRGGEIVKLMPILFFLNAILSLHSIPKNETMAPLHVATPTVIRELPKYDIKFSI